jgi:hypothetical protein
MSDIEHKELCPCCNKIIGIRQIYRHIANTRRDLELEFAHTHENLDLDLDMDLDMDLNVDVGVGNDLGADDIRDEGMYQSVSN